MLFGSKILFLHAPRTAGTSITQFLIDNVPERLTLLAPSPVPGRSVPIPAAVRVKTVLKKFVMGFPAVTRVGSAPGIRHQTLLQARDALVRFKRTLSQFDCIVSVMRNPYDLEVSRYHFLRRGYLGVKGLSAGRAQDLALEGDFTQFATLAPFLGRMPSRIEDWFELDGRIPDNLFPLRFETLEHDLEQVIGQFYPIRRRLRRLNGSNHEHYRQYLTPAAEEAIYLKFRWLFDHAFYEREK